MDWAYLLTSFEGRIGRKTFWIAIAAKRANDRDLPIWILIVFFGGGALLDLLTVLGLAGNNEKPSVLSLVIAVPFTVMLVALMIELGFRRGTIGPNRYGPDPVTSN